MGIIDISELIGVIKKHFIKILSLAFAGALIVMFLTESTQSYTCRIFYKYNYDKAAEGLAPDGKSQLDPYEIQNPKVIQAALKSLGLDKEFSVEGIRNDITINEIVQSLDKEVSESAALLGEKYDVEPVEYEVSYSYDASLGDEYGPKLIDSIIKEYDKFLLSKYYNKKEIIDFAKIVKNSSAEYLEIADAMSDRLESTIDYLDTLAESYPEYRSQRTGYSFSELSTLYQNLRDIQYAKYYGNIRAGNLAKDSEMVVKSYRAKVKDLQTEYNVNNQIAETYKGEISTFYDSYKATGLYSQARNKTDRPADPSENVFENFDAEAIVNTYDTIILNYTGKATEASNTARTIENYNDIIDSYANDTVDEKTKARLLKKNESIFKEISNLSAAYSDLANDTVSEYYQGEVGEDLLYLVASEVTSDKPVGLFTAFAFVAIMALAIIGIVIYELYKKITKDSNKHNDEDVSDIGELDEFRKAVYEQYKKGFDEFYTVYQPMFDCKTGKVTNYEVYIRWENKELGTVSPLKTIEYLRDLDLLKEFNTWLLTQICKMLGSLIESDRELPVLHVNCPQYEVENFGIADILVKLIKKYRVPAENICIEIDGENIADSMEDIVLLMEMGIKICIDHFEDKAEENEIIELINPTYIKMSSDTLHYDLYATTDEDIKAAEEKTQNYFKNILTKCENKGIKVCICGVEDKNQDDFISKIGFDFKQGYFYEKPKREI